jgi:hypothetical protein
MTKAKTTTKGIYLPLIRSGAVLAALLAIQPFLWNYVYSTTNQLQEKRTEAVQLTNLQASLADIQAHVNAQKQFTDQLSASFPLLGSESQVIERIEQLATRTGINAHITTIGKQALSKDVDKSEKITSLVLTVAANGPASRLFYFLDALEHLPEVTSVRSWKIEAAPAAAASGPAASPAPAAFNLVTNIVFYLQK